MHWITTTIMLDRLADAQDVVWDDFAAHFRAPVLHFAMRLGLPEAAAEDVVQSTMLAFISAYREGRYSKNRGRLSSWLFGIAYREALQVKRKIARERQSPQFDGRTTFFAGQPDEERARTTWTETWERHVLDRCMAQVSAEIEPSTYEAFELTALRGVPPEEVSSRLGLSRNAVFIAKHRVLKRIGELRREYEPESVGA